MDEIAFLRGERERALLALRASLKDGKSWVKSGRMARQTARHFPGLSLTAAVTGGLLIGWRIARGRRSRPREAEAPRKRSGLLRAAKAGAWSIAGILRAVAEAKKSSAQSPQ